MMIFYKISILALPTLARSMGTSPVCLEGDMSAKCIRRNQRVNDGGDHLNLDDMLAEIQKLEEEFSRSICSDLEDKYASQGPLPEDTRRSVCDNGCDIDNVECDKSASEGSWFGNEPTNEDPFGYDDPSEQTIEADAKLGRAVCKKLRFTYFKNGFVSISERKQLCKYACMGFPIDCNIKGHTYESYDLMNKFETWTEKLFTGEIKISDDTEIITESMLEAWYSMAAGNLIIALSVVPVLLNQWKYYNFWTATLVCIVYALVHLFIPVGTATTVHNFGVAILCAIVPAGSPVLVEGFFGMVFQIMLMTASFTTDISSQVIIFVLGFLGYFGAIYYCFFIRRQGANAGVAILIMQAYVMAERIGYAKEMFGITTNSQVIFEMSFNAIAPLGESRFFGKNAMRIAIRIVEYLGFDTVKHIQVTLLVGAQFIMLLAFRAALGTFYIHSLRYSFDAMSIVRGFWIYMIDAFGPFRVLFRILFKYEPVNPRRMMYGCVGLLVFLSEARGAYGLFCLRLLCTFSDLVFFRTTLGRAMHYLDFNVDFMQAAYSQDGAPPYVSLKTINEIAKSVDMVFVENSGRVKRGMGVLLSSANRTMLYSVKHVVDRAKMITFMGQSTSDPDFRTVGSSDDPIMAMKYDGDAANVEMLSQDEANDVQQLMFVNVIVDDKYKVQDRVTCVVPKFSLRNGRLFATVNLRKGDSGGPCFAALSDGTVRFCGVVSQGNPRRGGGNIVSICYASDMLEGNSSDDDSVGHGRNPRQFNRVRRNDFASQDSVKVRYDMARRLNMYLGEHQNTWDYGKSVDGRNLTWDDVDDPEQAAEDFANDYMERTRRADDGEGDDHGYDDDDPSPGDRKRKKKRDQKRRNKDKAMRKRNHYNHAQCCAILREKLTHVYSELDAENIYIAIVRSGHVPDLDDSKFISGADGDMFVLDSELPDPDWS